MKEISFIKQFIAEKREEELKEKYGSMDLANSRLKDLEKIVAGSQVVDTQAGEVFYVQFGCRVTLGDFETGKEINIRIVGEDEVNEENGDISVNSPLGKILLGKSIGDAAKISDGKNFKEYEIIEIYR